MKISALILFLIALPLLVSAQDKQPLKSESLKLNWPESEHWKTGDDQQNSRQHIVDLIHEGESVDKWTELGNMTTIKNVTGMAIDTAMIIMFSSARISAPDAKLTYIDRGEEQECQWILFTIEAPYFNEDTMPESQLWYVVQGKQSLFTNFVAVKKATLDEAFKTKWSTFFRKARLEYN